MRERLGLCQWFHYLDYDRVVLARELFEVLGVRHLRMDVSWADYHRPRGRQWYAWLFEALAEFELLPCVWHTPPSLSANGKSNGPPLKPAWFAEFLWEIMEQFGERFEAIELWNEPNNEIKWDRNCDPEWRIFADMVIEGAGTVAPYGKLVVLGGMSPIDGGWLDQLRSHDPHVLENVQAIGVHAFPGQWNESGAVWNGWPAVFEHLHRHVGDREIWLTEVGRSTSSPADEVRQVERLREVAVHAHDAQRIYWYSLLDLPTAYDELEFLVCGYREPLEHSLGLVAQDGRKKAAFFELQDMLRQRPSSLQARGIAV